MRKAFRAVVALGVSTAGLWWALRGVALAQLKEGLGRAEHLGLLGWVPAAMGLDFLARSLRWGALLSPSRLGKGRLYAITCGGFFLNNVLPLRAGEAARLFWTCRDAGRPAASGAAVLLMDRLFDMMVLASLLFLLMARGAIFPGAGHFAALFGAIPLAGLSILWVAARRPEEAVAWAERARLPVRVRGWIGEAARGAAPLSRPAVFLGLYGLSLSFWVMNAALYAAVSRVFGLDLSWTEGAALMLAFSVGAALPSAPGYIGTLEATGVALLGAAGHPRAVALPFVLTLHLAQILSSALYGVPALMALDKGSPRG